MKRILTRDVIANGVMFVAGTDVTKLPEDNQLSVIDSQWTTEIEEAPVDGPAGETIEINRGSQTILPPGTELQQQSESSDDESAESTGESTGDASGAADQKSEQKPADTRLLSELGLAADKLELLANNDPPITTVQQALDFVTVNKTFRTIASFGKTADQDLRRMLGVL
jgi:hypothetical protein